MKKRKKPRSCELSTGKRSCKDVNTIPLSAKFGDVFCFVIMRTNDVRYSCQSRFVDVENAILWGKIMRLERFLQNLEEIVDIFIFEARTKRQHILLALDMKSSQVLRIITDDPKGRFISLQLTATPFFSVHYTSTPKTFPLSAVCTSLAHPYRIYLLI